MTINLVAVLGYYGNTTNDSFFLHARQIDIHFPSLYFIHSSGRNYSWRSNSGRSNRNIHTVSSFIVVNPSLRTLLLNLKDKWFAFPSVAVSIYIKKLIDRIMIQHILLLTNQHLSPLGQ
jgi:hypothetical protein